MWVRYRLRCRLMKYREIRGAAHIVMRLCVVMCCYFGDISGSVGYTVKKAKDLLQVVNFTGFWQLVHQVATSLLKSGLLQLVICRLVD